MKHNTVNENVVVDFVQEEIILKQDYKDLCFLLISENSEHHEEAVYRLREKFKNFCEHEVAEYVNESV